MERRREKQKKGKGWGRWEKWGIWPLVVAYTVGLLNIYFRWQDWMQKEKEEAERKWREGRRATGRERKQIRRNESKTKQRQRKRLLDISVRERNIKVFVLLFTQGDYPKDILMPSTLTKWASLTSHQCYHPLLPSGLIPKSAQFLPFSVFSCSVFHLAIWWQVPGDQKLLFLSPGVFVLQSSLKLKGGKNPPWTTCVFIFLKSTVFKIYWILTSLNFTFLHWHIALFSLWFLGQQRYLTDSGACADFALISPLPKESGAAAL